MASLEKFSAFAILKKIRRGDRDVEVPFPQIEKYQQCTPILVDDIISTAQTMIETVNHLQNLKTLPPICIGVHGIFTGDAFANLQKAGVAKIVTCNSISHFSNAINIDQLLIDALLRI